MPHISVHGCEENKYIFLNHSENVYAIHLHCSEVLEFENMSFCFKWWYIVIKPQAISNKSVLLKWSRSILLSCELWTRSSNMRTKFAAETNRSIRQQNHFTINKNTSRRKQRLWRCKISQSLPYSIYASVETPNSAGKRGPWLWEKKRKSLSAGKKVAPGKNWFPLDIRGSLFSCMKKIFILTKNQQYYEMLQTFIKSPMPKC